ncbi:hypothetical protein ACIQWS_17960 [Phyllobacterium sp. NPDC097923]|uniref:hypothetical protein n=1 Tax=Phyllobacterium sp. NPDC097923 TaxID=3364404 RepID=UPI00383A498A
MIMRYQIQLLSVEYFALSLLLGLVLIPLLSSDFWNALRDRVMILLNFAGGWRKGTAARQDESANQTESASMRTHPSYRLPEGQRTTPKPRYKSKGGIRSAEWYGTRNRPVRRRLK